MNRATRQYRVSMSSKIMTATMLLMSIGFTSVCFGAEGQLECKKPPYTVQWDKDATSEAKPAITAKDLKPRRMEKAKRAIAIKLEVQDTPDFFFTEATLPATDTRPERHVIIAQPNPDKALLKGSITLDLSKLFDSSSDLKARYSALIDVDGLVDPGSNPLAGVANKYEYFSRTRGKDIFNRFLSTFSVNGGASERPKLEGNAVVPGPVLEEDDLQGTFGLTFDPIHLFNTGERINAAVSALEAYVRTYKDAGALMDLPCQNLDASCFEELTGAMGSARFWAAALPKFEFKSVDQFDFLQSGGRFLAIPLLEDTLETYTLTWDLGRIFNARADKLAALASLKTLSKLSKPAPTIRLGKRRFVGGPLQLLLLRANADGGIPKLVWDVKPHPEETANCKADRKGELIPGVDFGEDGTIQGYPEFAGTCHFFLRVTDSVGRTDIAECSISIPD